MLNRDLRTSPCNPSKPSWLGFRDLASPLAMWLCDKTGYPGCWDLLEYERTLRLDRPLALVDHVIK